MADKSTDSTLVSSEAAAYLAAIVSSSDDAIISKSLDGMITSWNGAAERLFGYTAQEAIGQHISLIIPPDRMDEETQIINQLRRGEKVDHFETIRYAKDGHEVEVSITVSPILDSKSRIIGASKIARDISERRKLEAVLKERADLLAEKDRRKDEYLAMLAHELRNPLAPISNALRIMQSGTIDPAKQQEMIHMASQQVEHMVRLLNDLLELSRITHGKVAIQRTRTDLCCSIKSAIASVQPLMEEREHHFKLDIPDWAIWVRGDNIRLAQLVGNLLNNAAKYTNPGGTISLRVVPGDGTVAMYVSDNGIGIAPEKLPNVFDMFMQVDNTLERTQGGLGIGLSLVRGIAELHHGSVTAFSAGTGHGTEFKIVLPILEPIQETQEVPLAANDTEVKAPASSFKVMVVDDNEASAKTLGWMLEALGYEAKFVLNAKAAIELAHEYVPNVVLLDIGMPDMNGFDLCEKLHQDPLLKNTTFIAQSGWSEEKYKDRSKEAGLDYHLVKPISMDALQKQLEQISRRSALESTQKVVRKLME